VAPVPLSVELPASEEDELPPASLLSELAVLASLLVAGGAASTVPMGGALLASLVLLDELDPLSTLVDVAPASVGVVTGDASLCVSGPALCGPASSPQAYRPAIKPTKQSNSLVCGLIGYPFEVETRGCAREHDKLSACSAFADKAHASIRSAR
jgi:hypothetical protein